MCTQTKPLKLLMESKLTHQLALLSTGDKKEIGKWSKLHQGKSAVSSG